MIIRCLVGTRKGLFVLSSDIVRGDWSIEGPLFKGWKVTAGARLDDGRYMVGTASDVYGPALHVSDDLETWRQIENGPSYVGTDARLEQIWSLRSRGEEIWCGVAEAGLFRSNDGGESWSPVEGINNHETRDGWVPGAGGLCAHTILFDKDNEDRIWCGISAVGAFVTEDRGSTWKLVNNGITPAAKHDKYDIGYCVHAMVQHPSIPDTIYRQDHMGMYRTTDGGGTWVKNESGLPSGFGFPIAIDPSTKSIFAFPQESSEYRIAPDGRMRVYRSRDAGQSWEALTNGLPQSHAYAGVLRGAMSVDGLIPCGVYFGTTAGTIHVSADAGEHWMQLDCLLPRILFVTSIVEH